MRLASIHLYPVKSMGGVEVDSATVQPWGLGHDRRWVVLRPGGRHLTARTERRLLGITAVPAPGSITLAWPDGAALTVAEPADGPPVATTVSRLDTVRLADPEAHEWLSERVGRPLWLGWLDDPRRRSVSAGHGGLPGDPLNLADAGPLLATTLPSLRRLDEWIARGAAERDEPAPPPLAMARFRPSVVIDGPFEPFAEDTWSTVHIGDIAFRFAERCDRCAMTLVDPRTLASGKEPVRTLARHRRQEGRTWFGVRLIPLGTGMIRAGDPVRVG
jgi:uncharacterized protein YcbX